mmetsp:Transcript_21248/g.51224  ORF Transcript_21248/g.51224 Transcript_21248/m.51224 type:complete len:271 (+) Transcript_21248:775-1587(+)
MRSTPSPPSASSYRCCGERAACLGLGGALRIAWSVLSAMWFTQWAWPSRLLQRMPLIGSHTLMVRSSLPEKMRPCPPQRTDVTLDMCPVIVNSILPVRASHTFKLASFDAVTIRRLWPSAEAWIGSHARLVIHLLCPLSGPPIDAPVLKSQMRAVLSMLPEAARVPSGLTAQQSTQFLCPFSVTIGVSVLRSQIRSVASPEPVSNRWQSGEKATQRIASVCPGSVPEQRVTATTRNVAWGWYMILMTSSVDRHCSSSASSSVPATSWSLM